MSTFPTNPALESAIVAHAEEDTPRLVYADWLDENGDPDRAAFIRVQCRLAEMPPDHPDWVDLIEQHDELIARVKWRQDLQPPDPDGFYFDDMEDDEAPVRRGFPYFIDCQLEDYEWDDEFERVCKEITKFIQTTTIRGIYFYYLTAPLLTKLLAVPAFAQLTGLSFFVNDDPTAGDVEVGNTVRLVANSPATRGLQELFLYGDLQSPAIAALANAKSFKALRRLSIHEPMGTNAEHAKLFAAPWVRRLNYLNLNLTMPKPARKIASALGELPELHTLELRLPSDAGANLASGKFRSLAKLTFTTALTSKFASALARAKFPRLAVLGVPGSGIKFDAFRELLKADWFAQLSVLDLSATSVGDKSVRALAAHPVAKTLRILRLGGNTFGAAGLNAIAKPGAFPELTTLDLGSYSKQKAPAAEIAKILSACQFPRLRHLNLSGWRVSNSGAKALATNPTFAGLTRLNLESCGIGDSGAEALVNSPHLQNLVELQMSCNSIKTGADALAKGTVMPRLGVCWLSGNKIPKKSEDKLQRRKNISLFV
ncbi:MAG: TIGR02996 domain-containing protein [Planctomycetia bacterium]|nr:TIGR02996 domain-containing protein [Planctomycetia bacterium]